MTIFNGLLEAKKVRSKTARSRRWPSPSTPLTKKLPRTSSSANCGKPTLTTATTISNLKSGKMPRANRAQGVGEFDETFATEHSFDGEKWVVNTPVVDSDSADIAQVNDLMKLPARERFAAVLLFSHDANEVDSELLAQTREYRRCSTTVILTVRMRLTRLTASFLMPWWRVSPSSTCILLD